MPCMIAVSRVMSDEPFFILMLIIKLCTISSRYISLSKINSLRKDILSFWDSTNCCPPQLRNFNLLKLILYKVNGMTVTLRRVPALLSKE